MLRQYIINQIIEYEASKMEGPMRKARRAVMLKVLRAEHENDLIIRHSIMMKEVLV